MPDYLLVPENTVWLPLFMILGLAAVPILMVYLAF
jgi:hypothetical protein